MRTVAVIQARMGSQRLPGKVLLDIAGQSMLACVVERLRAASPVLDEIVIATSTSPLDEAIVVEARRLDVPLVRGSEHDVLSRYLVAARQYDADAVVRVTADCPLLEPFVITRVVHALTPQVDYASNTHERTYPRGLDVEALHRDTLERLGRMATARAAREHVTAFILAQPSLFAVSHVHGDHDDSDLRWTVDTPEDLALVRALRAHGLPYRDLVNLVRQTPELMTLNAHIEQKSWRSHAP